MKKQPTLCRLLLLIFFSTLFSAAPAQFSAVSNSAGTVTVTTVGGGFDWLNPASVSANDNVYATSLITGSNKSTFHLDAKNWGFQTSNSALPNFIPSNATINGIEVFVKLRKSNAGSIRDHVIQLLKNGSTAGANKARGNTRWPTTATEIQFGSNIDPWGTTWTAADLVNTGFGVRIQARNRGSKDAQAEVDHIRVKVYFNQIYFYSKSAGNLELTGTWGSNTDGSGVNPSNFTNDGQIFFLQNRATATLTANMTISGAGSKMVVGNGSTATELTIPASSSLNAVVDVAASSSLHINNTIIPALGGIADNTTVSYGAAAAQPVFGTTYFNLTLSGTGTKTLQPSGQGFSTVNNVLTIAAGVTMDNGGEDVLVNGAATGISNNGFAVGAGRYVYSNMDLSTNITGTGTYHNLEVDFGTTGAVRSLTLSNPTTITGALYLTDGTLANGSNLTMASGSSIRLADGSLGSSIAASSGYDVVYEPYTTASPKTTANELSGTPRHFTVQTGSGFTVLLNRNLVLSGNLQLNSGTLDPSASNYAITLAGHFTNNAVLTYRNNTTTLNGSAAQTINGAASQSFHSLVINNTGGGVQLNVPVTVNNQLSLTSGIVTTSFANLLSISAAASISGGSVAAYVNGPMQHVLAALSGTRFFPIGKAGAYRPVSLALSQATTSSTSYTAEVISGAPAARTLPTGISEVSSVRYYIISCSNNANVSSATATFSYDGDDNVTDPAGLRVVRSSGSDWLNLGGQGSAAPAGTITTNNFNSFSEFALAKTTMSVLPLSWSSFTAIARQGRVELNWTTSNESNVHQFVIERSEDSRSWTAIGTVAARNQVNNQYNYHDNVSGMRLYYRIRSVDLDGRPGYSRTVMIAGGEAGSFIIAGNPASNHVLNLLIYQQDLLQKPVEVTIVNMQGQVVFRKRELAQPLMRIYHGNLSAGSYLLMLRSGEQRFTASFVTQ